ncbi:MAG: gamma-glutamyl-gamma-aminobutyrate hydrolase family protein [Chloroherpetonaceae bacterium]|nr:gamma-glutamyl-gamma-aminobutyrate hydrolase family protein [Chloroherpetonaceae bacterium]
MRTLRIGVTQCHTTSQYISWLCTGEKYGYKVECLELPYEGSSPEALLDQHLRILDSLDAVVFTGGRDVEPHRFGMRLSPEELAALNVVSTPERDAVEWPLAEACLERGIPILGICRGMQLLNVVMGGTLVLDIDTQIANPIPHKKLDDARSGYHPVRAEKDSLLYELVGVTETDYVSTRHHQAIDRIGDNLRAVGFSPDGLVEALESTDPNRLIMLVQWHPERMWLEAQRDQKPEYNNAFSENLLAGFLAAVAQR